MECNNLDLKAFSDLNKLMYCKVGRQFLIHDANLYSSWCESKKTVPVSSLGTTFSLKPSVLLLFKTLSLTI